MDLDTLLHHYFGTDDIAGVPTERLERGREQLAIDFGKESEPGRRFALWSLMFVLDIAPDPEEAFETERERSAARTLASLASSAGD